MATSALKSAAITNLDAIPLSYASAGEGAAARVQSIEGFVTANTGDAAGSTYRMVRLPTNAKVKKVELRAACVTAGAADVNVAFSDSTTDGTDAYLQGTIPQVSAANNKLFGAAQSLTGGINVPADLTFANATNFPAGSRMQPLWQVLGFNSDPGGMFDILLVVTTAVTTGGAVAVRVEYAE